MKVIINTIASDPEERDSEVGATIEATMNNVPRIGETLQYDNSINNTHLFVRVSDIDRRVHVKKDGTIEETAILTGILSPNS